MNLRAAYTASRGAWQHGPGRIYDRLAEALVARCPGGVGGRRVLDLGAGTGAASRAAIIAGASNVIASDVAVGMLTAEATTRPSACAGDAVALPFADQSFDAVVAAFSLNHLADPVRGLAEAARVLAPGGGLAVSAYAEDDTHPVKEAVDASLRARGWKPEPWYVTIKAEAVPRLATADRAAAALEAARLHGAEVEAVREPFPELSPADLVAWRLGMAQVATFVSALGPDQLAEIAAEAGARLGADPPVLVRSFIVAMWRKP